MTSWSDSGEGSLPGLQTAAFLLCLHIVVGGRESILISSFCGGSTLMPSSNPNHIPKAPPPDTIHWGLGLRHMNLGEHNSVYSMRGGGESHRGH